ncbi:MAG TPA: DUF1015 domain-containing protein [Chryseosolibacter sp.]|nr:DUF1015 domain-containing protein [Chryseosolibacter sp.]
MAEIRPIRAWRYHPQLLKNIEEVTAPLFDVVSDKQRQALYKKPYNSIHLSVPQPPDAATRAATLLSEWKEKGIIVQDLLPGIYVYYQHFKIPGDPTPYCRKGFISHIRTYEWAERVILRHENTIPKAVNDRVELLEKTGLHSSATHGLYTDPHFELEKFMDEAMTNPLVETEDYQGVRDVLAVIQDATVIQRFIDLIASKQIILADGHHRYEGSLIYKKKMLKKYPGETRRGFNYHLMYLTNTESGDLKILPTHRIIKNLPAFDEGLVYEKLHEDFIVKPVDDSDTLQEIIAGKQWAFGLIMKGGCYKVRLKPESFGKLNWPFPAVVKKMDLTVMHYFIIEKILGIPGRVQRRSEILEFERRYSECLNKVMQGEALMAIITNEISIDEVKTVCQSGYTMPQKSTYFYPKVIGGFLFTSVREDEFQEPVYSPFYYEA